MTAGDQSVEWTNSRKGKHSGSNRNGGSSINASQKSSTDAYHHQPVMAMVTVEATVTSVMFNPSIECQRLQFPMIS